MGFFALIIVAAAIGTLAVGQVRGARPEALMLQCYVGLCLCAVGVLALGSVSLLAVRVVIGVSAIAALVYAFRSRTRGGPDDGGEPLPVKRYDLNSLESICLAVVLIGNALALLSALAPVTSWDAGVAHLALPSDYAREGHIGFVEGNVYSAYPHLLHSLYTYVFAESGETSTALLSWFFGVLACLATYDLGRRIENRQCGLIAAAILASSPIYFSQAGTVSIDLAFAGVTMAVLAMAYAWHEEKRLRWIVLAAFLGGSACGMRHTGYLVCAFVLLGLFASSGRDRFRASGLFGGVAALSAVPWLIRSAVVSGNPVYPFLRSVFGVDRLPDVQTTALLSHETATGAGLVELLMFPWTLVMRPEWYDGWTASPGPMVLLLGPPALVIGGAKVRWLGAFSIAGGACFYFFQRLARYVLPFFTPMMVVAAVGAMRLKRLRRPVTALLIFSFGYGLLLGTAMIHFKLPVVLGLEFEWRYLENRLERFEAFRWANTNLPEDATIMTFDPRSYYLDRPTYQNFEVLPTLAEMDVDAQVSWLYERGIRYFFYPEAYVTESPIYAERGFLELLDRWRTDSDHFRLIHEMELPRPHSDDIERVEIYEVLRGDNGEASGDVGA